MPIVKEPEPMKVFIACLSTESNTFSPFPTGYRSFAEDGYLVHRGQHDEEMKGKAYPVFIFRRYAEAQGWKVVESLCAATGPSGRTVRSVYEEFRREILDDLKVTLPVDMVFLDLHGAMVADGYDDCEGDLLAHIRESVGPDVPIGVTLDPHCHLTSVRVENATILVMAKEYPHMDFAERTQDVFRILTNTVEGKVHPHMAVFDCRMILSGLHTTREPGRSLVDHIMRLEREDDDVLSISFCHSFPWGDVPEMGAKVLVVTDNKPEKGAALAGELGRKLFDLRHDLAIDFLTVDETLDLAHEISSTNPGKPVVISDTTDNTGGGAPGDSTFVLKAMLDRGIQGAVVAMIWDPVVVGLASDAGEGAHLALRIGGKMGPSSGNPIDVHAQIVKVGKGVTQAFGEGGVEEIGDAVVIRVQGIDIILNTQRRQVVGVDCLTNMGIDPMQKRIIVVKSSQHFYASFAPIAAEVLYCIAPGTLMMNVGDIAYRRIDRDKWPFVENPFADWDRIVVARAPHNQGLHLTALSRRKSAVREHCSWSCSEGSHHAAAERVKPAVGRLLKMV
jgi:microcystin degradation protein MlrC